MKENRKPNQIKTKQGGKAWYANVRLVLLTLLIALFSLLVTTCDIFGPNNPDYYQELLDEVAYANAPYANVSIGIIPGSLSAAPTEVPREKVGFPFSVQATENAGYGFAGWRVLTKDAWDNLSEEVKDGDKVLTFEEKFIDSLKSSPKEESALAKITDIFDLSGKATGRAEIIALTTEPIVIVPYATMRPAISRATYPAMNARDIPYMNWINIWFDAPVAEDAFNNGDGKLQNIEITGISSSSSKELTDCFILGDVSTAASETEVEGIEKGKLLRLRLNELGGFSVSDFEGMLIEIKLTDQEIKSRGNDKITMMPNQELRFYTTTNISVVNTRLNSLTVIVDGNPHDFSSSLSSEFEFTVPAVYAAQNVRVNAAAVQPNDVSVAASGAVTVLSTETALSKGRSAITISVTQLGGGGQTIYRVNINNYPSSEAPTVTLTPAAGHLDVSWNVITGADGYWVYYNTTNDRTSAQRFPNPIIDLTNTTISGAPGSTLFVWVQAVSGTGTNRLDSPAFSADGNSAKILGSNNTLRTLSVDTYNLNPIYYFNTENYELLEDTPNNVNSVTVNFNRGDDDQTVTWRMNGGLASANVTGTSFLATGINNIGLNTLEITVSPADTSASSKTYKILIFKKPAVPAWTATDPFSNFSEGSVRVNWTLTGVTGHHGIEVYRSTSGTAGSGGVPFTEASNTATSTVVGGLLVNSNYFFWIRSYKNEGGRRVYSEWSSPQTLSTNVTMSSFSIKNIAANVEHDTGGNEIFIMDLDYAPTHTLAVTVDPTSAAAAAVITAGNSIISFSGNTATITWGERYETSFQVDITAQHPSYKRTYVVIIKRPPTTMLSGTVAVNKPSDREINLVMLTARKDSHTGTIVGAATADASAGLGLGSPSASCAWTIYAPSANIINQTELYWTVSIFDTNGNMYAKQDLSVHTGGIAGDVPGINHSIAIYGVNITQQSAQQSGSPGTINTMRPAYQQNETVSLIAMPSQNFIFNGKPVVSGINAGNITQTDNNFTFTMPAANVSVSTDGSNRFLCTDATLEGLTLTNVSSFTFLPFTTNYTVSTSLVTTTTTTVTPTKLNPYTSITVNTTSTPSDTGKDITTNTGRNTIAVVVTPESGAPVTYTINVERSPAAPAGEITLEAGFDHITASWNPVTDADRYEVEYEYTEDNILTVNRQITSNPFLPLVGLKQGIRHYVRVRASTDSVTGGWTENTDGSIPGLATTYEGLQKMITQVATKGTVYLLNTGTFDVNNELIIPVGKTITLIPHNGTTTDSGTVTLQRVSGHTGAMINVNAGGILNLRSSNTNTNSGTLNIDGGAIWTDSNGDGYMAESEITDGIKTATSAAVVVSGTLTMYDGVYIENNYHSGSGLGGGVSIFGGGSFTMEGGTIRQNRANAGGGVIINANNSGDATGTSFTMRGGSIKTNFAISGGGVASQLCTAELSGGLIINNSIDTTSNDGAGWHALNSTLSDLPAGGIAENWSNDLIINNINLGTGFTRQYVKN